ncbi:MAG: lysophospholipid acyltransferase family protein [Candidatus Methylacidiphilales bacterium]|nr:lysophospholipid acyltransferase family protein [Candidatus Methylacidiphilales bacterium]
MKKKLLKHILPRLLKGVAPALIRLLCSTLRFQIVDNHGLLQVRDRPPVLFVFWHNRILAMPYIQQRFNPGRKLTVLMSKSRDGSFISGIAARFGIDAIRGSSSKGAVAALLAIHRLLRLGGVDFALSPDGPRGPRYQVHNGILQLGRKTGLSIVPITPHYSSFWELQTWDRFQIPRPFCRCRILVGRPIQVGESSDEAIAEEIQSAMAGVYSDPLTDGPHTIV